MPNLIGTAPDQVPVNGFLGNMAFQNKEGVVTDLLSTTALTVTGAASFAGTIAAGLGSAAAPSYTFIGDTNTGIFSPAADTIAFSEGGAEVMRITSAGNVGIGTSSPDTRLTASSTSQYAINTLNPTSVGGSKSGIAFYGLNSSTATQFYAGIVADFTATAGGAQTGAMLFETINNNSVGERMRITGPGNVGIGTATVSSKLDIVGGATQRKLQLNGSTFTDVTADLFIGRTGTNNSALAQAPSIQFGNATDASGVILQGSNIFQIFTNNAGAGWLERMRIDSSGNVGINQPPNASQGRVQINQPLGSSVDGALRLTDNATTSLVFNNISNGLSALWSSGAVALGTGSNTFTERMRIDTSGNVGIGISTPDARLHLHSTAGGGDFPRLRFTNGGTGTAATDGMFVGISNTSQLDIWNFENDAIRFATNNAERMRINAAGDVGVGVAPSAWGSTYRALEVRTGAIYDTPAGTSSGFTFNAYFNGTNWLYKGTGGNATALRYEQGGAGHQWFSAPSGAGGATVSFTNTMVLNGSGNVGIGTGLPITRLHVSQSNAGDYASVVLLSNSANAAADRTGIYGSPASGTANPYRGGITFWPGSSGAVSIHTGNNTTPGAGEAMRIDGSGNVGIGTTSPDNLLTLGTTSANQGLALKQSTITVARFGIVNPGVDNTPYIGSISNNAFAFWANNAERMRIDSSGNVGIGTLNPRGNLSVGTDSSANNTEKSIHLGYTAANFYGFRLLNANSPSLSYAGTFSIQRGTGAAWSDALLINDSGNVGIGTSSPTEKLVLNSAGSVQVATKYINGNTTGVTVGAGSDGSAFVYQAAALPFIVYTNGTERARVDSSGNLLVGTTVEPSGVGTSGVSIQDLAGTAGRIFLGKTASGACDALANYHNGTYVGGVVYSNTATSFPTSSDIRLKHDIIDAPEASSLIDAIQVRSFKWNADNTEQRYGFVAQELVTVAPEAVSQPEDPDGMMGVDYSKLVPMLVKEIQSLRARVAQLEGN